MTPSRSFILNTDHIKANALSYIQSLPIEPKKPYKVSIGIHERKRRVEANNYYWLILTYIALEAERLGVSDKYYQPEYWHEYFKKLFLGKRVVIDGDIQLLPETTTNKTVLEFMDYTTQVEVWAAEHGILIPNLKQER